MQHKHRCSFACSARQHTPLVTGYMGPGGVAGLTPSTVAARHNRGHKLLVPSQQGAALQELQHNHGTQANHGQAGVHPLVGLGEHTLQHTIKKRAVLPTCHSARC